MAGVGSRDIDDGLINEGIVYSEITVGTSAVELKVGGSVLDDRKMIHMQARSNKVFWGYDNTVTTTTGTQIFKDQFMALPIGPDVSIWFIGDVSGRTVRIAEMA